MTNTTHSQPPKEFVEQVKQALERLYDFGFLQTHPLAQPLAASKRRPSETEGHHLRRELMTAIEALNPEPGSSVQTREARLYNLLQLHYVEGLTVQEVGQRLGLSTRQTHRSLRKAEEGVAAILWARMPQDTPAPTTAAQLSSVEMEIDQLETNLQPTDLLPLLQEAERAVAPLAQARDVSFRINSSQESVVVSADTAVSRQLLVSIFSRIAQAGQPGNVDITLDSQQDKVTLTFSYDVEEGETAVVLDEVVAPFASRLGWQIRTDTNADQHTIRLELPLRGPVVLVIDDNQGLVELLERYLTGNDCRVVSANSGQAGLDLAQQVTPDAVILDAMMPGMSGWEVLQTLRVREETRPIPIIICSVFNDPELAYSLGASYFLSKPIRRDNVLTALRELKVV
ncbi:MAG: response regulator [Chloroflexi bacterium]|nr:MAG: response regulator [Chloroflexota bacterium]